MKGSKPKRSVSERVRVSALSQNVDELTTFVGNPSLNPPAIDTVLLLEKVLEPAEQKWIENLNLIEHFLVNVVENQINLSKGPWKCQFLVRRLPTFIASCSNLNEYAIILDNFDFSLSPSSSAGMNSSSTCSSTASSLVKNSSGKLTQNLGQTEVFWNGKGNECHSNGNGSYVGPAPNMSDIVIEGTNAYCSNELFKQFGSTFVQAFHQEMANINNPNCPGSSTSPRPPTTTTSNKIQVIAPHLLAPLKQNSSQVDKIFKLTQSTIPITGSSQTKVSKSAISINHLVSTITICLDETKVIIRPALFYYPAPEETCDYQTKLNKLIIERLPLHNPLILQILQSLTKGYLLFPTNCDTTWNFGYWPSESHILSIYHSSSVPSRILKLFSCFCCQPELFLELVSPNRNLLFSEAHQIPVQSIPSDESDTENDDESPSPNYNSLDSFNYAENGPDKISKVQKQLGVEFFIHCFLTALETFPNVEDWCPSSFSKRLFHLFTTTTEALDKYFYPNYFVKTNLLKGLWKGSFEFHVPSSTKQKQSEQEIQDFIDDNGFGEGEASDEEDGQDYHCGPATHHKDDDAFSLEEIDLRHYAEIPEDEMPSTDPDFDMKLEELNLNDEDDNEVRIDAKPCSSSGSVSASSPTLVNPFSTFEQVHPPDQRNRAASAGTESTTGFVKLMRRISSLGRRKSSPDETELVRQQDKQKLSKDDHAIVGFAESINQMRREQSLQHHLTPPPPQPTTSRSCHVEYDVVTGKVVTSTTSYVNQGFNPDQQIHQHANRSRKQQKESVYKIITDRLCSNELFYATMTPPSPDFVQDAEGGASGAAAVESEEERRHSMMAHLEASRKILYAQDELITSWRKVAEELIRPKYICPHAFSPRQIQYISLLVSWIVKCTLPPPISTSTGATMTSSNAMSSTWEISGDILRTVLYQMRSESNGNLLKKRGQQPVSVSQPVTKKKAFSFNSKNSNEDLKRPSASPSKKLSMKFSFYQNQHGRGSYDICKAHHHHLLDTPESSVINDEFEMSTFGMENPDLAATHRLLQWLWQLRNSKIGRLSLRASQYLEKLHETSLINAFFLEQWSSQNILQGLALKSAIAVTSIISSASATSNEKFPIAIPLVAAWKKGWLWSEMVLSLVSWNVEKGIELKAQIPILRVDDENGTAIEFVDCYKIRDIHHTISSEPARTGSSGYGNGQSSPSQAPTLTKQLDQNDNHVPDDNAITLAFHSEVATPIGWHDFEDPRRPGPFTIPILIFSSTFYYNQWEVIGGNVIQVMTRLQKFNSLQQIGTLLSQPHKKTALNEIRKLNKSTSFRTFQFDGNVMTKTFRRLASLRNTRQRFFSTSAGRNRHHRRGHVDFERPQYVTCDQVGCVHGSSISSTLNPVGAITTVTLHGRTEFECTKL